MSNYLVTGGAGFIGSHIVDRLVKDGHNVRVIDNFCSGKRENIAGVLNKIELIEGDIRDCELVKKATQGVDFVLHQAALRSVPKSLTVPHEYNEVNIDGMVNLLQSCIENKVKRLVFASSSSIYGDTESFPENEEIMPQPISPYALTKIAGEYYCRIFSEIFGLSAVALRYFNVFGPRQSLDDEYAVVVPKFITCIAKNQPPPIYGNGKQSRDFTYIDNVVEANILAAETPDIKWAAINIANGKDNSVLELVDAINNIMGKNVLPVFENSRPGDVFKTLADIAKAEKILRFKPKVDFEKGLRLTIKWFEKEKLL